MGYHHGTAYWWHILFKETKLLKNGVKVSVFDLYRLVIYKHYRVFQDSYARAVIDEVEARFWPEWTSWIKIRLKTSFRSQRKPMKLPCV